MQNPKCKIKDFIISSLKKAIADCKSLPVDIEPILEPPKMPAHGDLSTNIAMLIASRLGKDPRDMAGEIVGKLEIPPDICEKVDIAGPGFINFYLAIPSVYKLLKEILSNPQDYGNSEIGKGKSVLIEFVSANPTGPLTIAHARQAAVGDILSNIMANAGFNVTREYYLNDRGRQMRLLSESTRARYLELLGEKVDLPADGYKGEYIVNIARNIIKKAGDRYQKLPEEDALEFFQKYTVNEIMDMIKKDLVDFGVEFTSWVSETELVNSGIVDKALQLLEEKGYVEKEEGAVWFKSMQFGDDKDRVLVKSTGEMTYLLPDIAYHDGKYKKGFSLLIDLWGPDHHGYVPRLKAAVEALGHLAESLNVIIVQLTTLYRDGKQISMSTRAGEYVSLRDLLNEVGRDAARYFLVMRRPEAHLDFDLALAKKETPDNPVYYIQYAHARISSIFSKYEEVTGNPVQNIDFTKIDVLPVKEPEEIALIKFLSQYPVIIEDCTQILSPHLLTDYLESLVSKFHNYYEKHRVVSSDEKLTLARISLIHAVQIVLVNALKILGVSIPERM